MRILYTGASGPKPALEQALGCVFVPLEELLRRADFVSLHCRLNEKTHHLIGKEQLACMKPEAYLINTGRGALVDEAALAQALAGRVIAGAGLDVFEFEPAVTEQLKSLPNVVMTPHLGASSRENRTQMAFALRRAALAALGHACG